MTNESSNLLIYTLMTAVVLGLALRKAYRKDVLISRRWHNQCIGCGYDLRASTGNCPECGKVIPIRIQDLTSQGRYVVNEDIQCLDCGKNLSGSYSRGECPVCRREVPSAIYAHIARVLGVTGAQVAFIADAFEFVYDPANRSAATGASDDCCIAVREYAIHQKGSVAQAKQLLIELGITSSVEIGRAFIAMVDCGLFETSGPLDVSQFEGLYTLDDLMKAEPIRASRLAAVENLAAQLGVSVEQVNFILDAVIHCATQLPPDRAGPRPHLSAREACIAVRDSALDIAGSDSEARAMLTRLGITGSESIGNTIWAAVNANLLQAADDDRHEQFIGMFTLDELMIALNS